MPALKAIAAAGTPEWHAARMKGVGASESPGAVGLSRWETPIDVWSHKTGRTPAKVETPAMALGTLMEPVIWEYFERQSGIAVSTTPGLFQHPDLTHVLASPDAMLADGRIGESKVTTDANDDLGDGNDDLPNEWICQAWQQMAVTGAPAVAFAVLVVPQQIREWLLGAASPRQVATVLTEGLERSKVELRQFTVERHSEGMDRLLSKVTDFWTNNVVADVMPDPDWSKSRTVEAIKRACLATSKGKSVDLDLKALEIVDRLQELKSQAKTNEQEQERLDAELRLMLGDAEAGRLSDGRVVKKSVIPSAEIAYTRAAYARLYLPKGK